MAIGTVLSDGFEEDKNIAGTYKTLSNGFFGETLVLEPKGVCCYSMFSDLKTEGEKEPRNVKGTYTVKGNTLSFKAGSFEAVREIRKINGIYTLWRNDSIEEWENNHRYRAYGIMIKCIKAEYTTEGDPEKTGIMYYGNSIERLWTNEVEGITIEKNRGQILKVIPEKWKGKFKRESSGKYFINIHLGFESLYNVRYYEYDLDANGFHVNNGIEIIYFRRSTVIKSISSFRKGYAHGLRILFYQNGRIRFKENFKQGKRHGLYQLWNKQGKLTAQAEYKNGSPVEGKVRQKITNPDKWGFKYILIKYKNGEKSEYSPCDEEGNIIKE